MEDIRNWLSNGKRDYSIGVELFGRYSRNKILYRNFKRGNATKMRKLEYELGKLTAVSKPHEAGERKEISIAAKVEKPNNAEIPAIVQETKNRLVDLRASLAILHVQLYELGESNDDDTVRKRKKLLDEKSPLITLYENLYKLKEEYFLTKIINPKLEVLLHNHSDLVLNNNAIDYETLSDIELERTKNRLSVQITKLSNRLKYQSTTKQEKENPMPDCPQRKEVERKLENLVKSREKVCKLIEKRCQK